MKELGDVVFIVSEVVFVGGAELYISVFELNENEGDAVDIEDDIGAAILGFWDASGGFDPELRNGEVLVIFGLFKVDGADLGGLFFALVVFIFHADTIPNERIHFSVGFDVVHDGATLGYDFDHFGNDFFGNAWI